MLGVPSAFAKPCETRLTPRPPTGCPRLVKSRRKLKCASFTVVALIALVSAQRQQLRAPVVSASNPGTLAPLCAVGYGLSRLKSSIK